MHRHAEGQDRHPGAISCIQLAGSDCIVTSLVESDGLGEAIGIPASVFLVKSLTKGLLLRSG